MLALCDQLLVLMRGTSRRRLRQTMGSDGCDLARGLIGNRIASELDFFNEYSGVLGVYMEHSVILRAGYLTFSIDDGLFYALTLDIM